MQPTSDVPVEPYFLEEPPFERDYHRTIASDVGLPFYVDVPWPEHIPGDEQERAIETHAANHPWARHFHDDIQNVNPRAVFDERDPTVTILSGGIECTHWSTARGGKPVDEQKRMSAWDFLTWVQKLRPEHILVENVTEFRSWGPSTRMDSPLGTARRSSSG